jgi:hypothetical protein
MRTVYGAMKGEYNRGPLNTKEMILKSRGFRDGMGWMGDNYI